MTENKNKISKKITTTSLSSALLGLSLFGGGLSIEKVKADNINNKEKSHLYSSQSSEHIGSSSIVLGTKSSSNTTKVNSSSSSSSKESTSSSSNSNYSSSSQVISSSSSSATVLSNSTTDHSTSSSISSSSSLSSSSSSSSSNSISSSSSIKNENTTADESSSTSKQTSSSLTSSSTSSSKSDSSSREEHRVSSVTVPKEVADLFTDDTHTHLADTTTQEAIDSIRKNLEQATNSPEKEAALKLLSHAQDMLFQWTFNGIGNYRFAVVRYFNDGSGKLFIDVKGKPHDYFSDAYFSIRVLDKNGNIVYQKDLLGDKYWNFSDQLILTPGMQLQFYHAEPSRNVTNNPAINKNTLMSKNYYYYVNDNKQLIEESDYRNLKAQIETLFTDSSHSNLAVGITQKDITARLDSLGTSKELTAQQLDELKNSIQTAQKLFDMAGGFVENDKIFTEDIFVLDKGVNDTLNEGRPMGTYHDRQDLGIILQAGSTIRIHQSNSKYHGNLTLRLLGDDSHNEKAYTIYANGEWITITVDHDLVAFIDTPIGLLDGERPQIEFEIIGGKAKKLPTFSAGDNQADFIKEWDSTKAQYAIIKGNNIQLFAPIKDLKTISALDLNQLLYEYDEQLFPLLNGLTGIKGNTSLTDHTQGRFFVKADVHGAGSAYYSRIYTAQHADSIGAYLSLGWLPIHEIGHGYEVNTNVNVTDVMNNVYGTIYQLLYLANFEKDSWLFGNNKNKVVDNLINNLKNNVSFSDSNSYGDMLLMLLNLASYNNFEAFLKFNELHRQLALEKSEYANDFGTIWAMVYSNNYHLNIIPYLKTIGISVNPIISANIFDQNYEILSMLFELVPDDKINEVLHLLGWDNGKLNSKVSLITTSQLSKLNANLTSNVQINIDNANKLQGSTLDIMDGDQIVQSIIIDNSTINLGNIKNGTYQLVFSNSNGWGFNIPYITINGDTTINVKAENKFVLKEVQDLFTDDSYSKVSDTADWDQIENLKRYLNNLNNEEQKKFNLELLNKAHSMIQQWDLNGLADRRVVTIIHRNNDGILEIRINSGEPHSYFNTPYITIKITNPDGTIAFEKELIGDQYYGNETFKISIKPGSKITITHAEPGRCIVSDSSLKVDKEKTLDYEVTDSGKIRLVGTNTAPVINVPSDEVVIEAGSHFNPLKGVSAFDADDGDLTKEIMVYSNVDTKKPGKYQVTYTIVDKDGHQTVKTIIVSVEPKQAIINQAPVINVPSENISINAGTSFDLMANVSAVDAEDGVIPVKIIQSNFDATQPGTYQVTYEAVDSNGAKTTKTITITVVEQSLEEPDDSDNSDTPEIPGDADDDNTTDTPDDSDNSNTPEIPGNSDDDDTTDTPDDSDNDDTTNPPDDFGNNDIPATSDDSNIANNKESANSTEKLDIPVQSDLSKSIDPNTLLTLRSTNAGAVNEMELKSNTDKVVNPETIDDSEDAQATPIGTVKQTSDKNVEQTSPKIINDNGKVATKDVKDSHVDKTTKKQAASATEKNSDRSKSDYLGIVGIGLSAAVLWIGNSIFKKRKK